MGNVAGCVSIHAPAWGATSQECGIDYTIDVSIHAPAWGATRCGGFCFCCGQVSIHAPAWGATEQYKKSFDDAKFQSTPPRGGRRAV